MPLIASLVSLHQTRIFLDLSKIIFANHFKKNMAVCGLFPHLNSTESYKTLEQWFIFHSATLDHGINESYSFN